MKTGKPTFTPLILAALLVLGPATMSRPAEPQRNGAPRIVCSLDRPVTGPNRPVNAEVFTDAPPGTSPSYRWKATGGRFVSAGTGGREAAGQTVAWSSSGARPGTYRLSVNDIGTAGVIGVCTLKLLVSEAVRSAPSAGGLGSEAERDMLVRGGQESENYGLYSYILLGTRPDDTNTDRYRSVLKAWLSLEDIRLETYFPARQLNVTYVPVDREPPADLDVSWVLDHYDYARARFLLSHLNESDRDGDGPFIVSALRPLGGDSGPGLYISQNFSTVPLSVVPNWMRAFRSQTTQQRVWQKRSIGTVALSMRTMIAVAAEGLPMAQESVKEWIRFRDAP